MAYFSRVVFQFWAAASNFYRQTNGHITEVHGFLLHFSVQEGISQENEVKSYWNTHYQSLINELLNFVQEKGTIII